MNKPMQTLYGYILDNDFDACLCTEEFRYADRLLSRLEEQLRQTLRGDSLELFQTYLDALEKHQLLELEAMFQAAFTLRGRLD